MLNELTLLNGQNHKVAVDDPDTPLLHAFARRIAYFKKSGAPRHQGQGCSGRQPRITTRSPTVDQIAQLGGPKGATLYKYINLGHLPTVYSQHAIQANLCGHLK
jgi:hypothetical protein